MKQATQMLRGGTAVPGAPPRPVAATPPTPLVSSNYEAVSSAPAPSAAAVSGSSGIGILGANTGAAHFLNQWGRSTPRSQQGAATQPYQPTPPARSAALPLSAPISQPSGSAGVEPPFNGVLHSPTHTHLDRRNFWEALPHVKAAIHGAAFVAIDLEMTGLWERGAAPTPLDGLEARYHKLRNAACAFMPVQLGISCFAPREGGSPMWDAQTFCITLYPGSVAQSVAGAYLPSFTVRADCLEFLAAQGFDPTTWVCHGARFLPLAVRATHLAQMDAAAFGAGAGQQPQQPVGEGGVGTASVATSPPRGSSTARRGGGAPQDPLAAATAAAAAALAADVEQPLPPALAAALGGRSWAEHRAAVLTWLQDAAQAPPSPWQAQSKGQPEPVEWEAEASTQAAAAYLLALIRLELWCRPDLPSFTPSLVGRPAGRWVVRLQLDAPRHHTGNPAPVRGAVPRRMDMHRAAGPSVLLDIIRDAGRPIVVHNGLLDLALLMAQLRGGPLPDTWQGFKAVVKRWFPGGIFDTKHLASLMEAEHSGRDDAAGAAAAAAEAGAPDATPLQSMPLLDLFCTTCAGLVAGSPTASQAGGGGPALVQHAPGFGSYQSCAVDAIAKHLAQPAPGRPASPPDSSDSDEAGPTPTGAAAASKVADDEDGLAAAPGPSGAHEAGFDAFMTGAALTALAAALARRGQAGDEGAYGAAWQDRVLAGIKRGAWRLHGGPGMPWLNLAGQDPPPLCPNVFFVSGLPPQATWYEIAQRFQGAGLGPVRVFLHALHPTMWGGDSMRKTLPAAASGRHGGSKAQQQQRHGAGPGGSTTALVMVMKAGNAARVLAEAHRLDAAWTVRSLHDHMAAQADAN